MDHPAAVNVHGYVLDAPQVPLWQRAMELARRRAFEAAIGEMATILARQPDFVPAMLQMAHLLLAADHYREAHASALRAVTYTPRSPQFALELIRLLRRFEEHEGVSQLVERTDWRQAGSAGILVQVAGELGPIGLYSQASWLLDLAETIEPGHPQARAVRGTLLLVSGDMRASRKLLLEALATSKQELPHIQWMLTMHPEPESIDGQMLAIEEALRRTSRGSEDEAYLWYALHNLHHAAGRFEDAWRALERGCRAKRALLAYDPEVQRGMFDALQRMRVAPEAGGKRQAGDSPRIVFIVGMHRSGTSVLERVLSGHSDVFDGGESYVFPAAMRAATDHFATGVIDPVIIARAPVADLGMAGQRFREYAQWRAGGRGWFTEKLPTNFLNLGFILQAMPEAYVLHMRRDPMDTCFSNLRTFFSQAAPYSYDQTELAEYFLMYSRLMRHWHEIFPGRILDVDYGEFVADPEAQSRRVMAFCDLDFQQDALDVSRQGGYSATASATSVRRGILKDRGGAWKNYRQHLQPLLDGLQLDVASAIQPET